MKKISRIKNKKGFTLVEIIVVVVVIMILAALLTPNLMGYMQEQKKNECDLNMKSLMLFWDSAKVAEPDITMTNVIEKGKGVTVTCPSGGKYSATKDSKDRENGVKCSHSGHGENKILNDDNDRDYNKLNPQVVDTYTVTYLNDDGSLWKTDDRQKDDVVRFLEERPRELKGSEQFLGWYEDGAQAPYNKSKLVESDITLTAKFSEGFVATFLDSDQVTAIEKQEAGEDKKISERGGDGVYIDFGRRFKSWALKGDEAEYDFGKELEENITLVPKLSEINMVVFDTKGGSKISPVILEGEDTVKRPDTDPTKTGYTFAGWVDKDGAAYKFGSVIEGTEFVYAAWEAAEVDYLINFWVEKVNGAENAVVVDDISKLDKHNYEMVYSQDARAKADSIVKLDANTVENVSFYSKANADIKILLNASSFKGSDCKENPISPTGNTVINVYWTRTVFTLNFSFQHLFNTLIKPEGTKVEHIVLENGNGERYSVTGTEAEDVKADPDGLYTITYKYGDTLNGKWPALVDYSYCSDTYKSNKFTTWSGYWGNGNVEIGQTHIWVPFCTDPAMEYRQSDKKQLIRPVRTKATIYPNNIKATYTEQRYYYAEMSEAEIIAAEAKTGKSRDQFPSAKVQEEFAKWSKTSSSGVYTGTRYYKMIRTSALNSQLTNPGSGAKGWPGTSILGYEPIGTDSPNECRTGQFQEVFLDPDEKISLTNHYRINYFMPAVEYKLTLAMNGGMISEAELPDGYTLNSGNYTMKMKYKENIELPADTAVNKENYKFIGWYEDAKFIKEYTGKTMPAGDLVLYAKFKGTEVQMKYHDDNELLHTEEYARNDYFSAHPTMISNKYKKGESVPGKGIFNGWFYEVSSEDGTQTAFMEFPQGIQLMDDTYDLYASWTAEIYEVKLHYMDENVEDIIVEISSRKNSFAQHETQLSHYAPAAREGYTLQGWTTKQGDTGANFFDSTKILRSMSVYVAWRPINYKIQFVIGDGSGAISRQDMAYDTAANLSAFAANGCTPPTGYKFVGWSTVKGGSVAYTDGAEIKNLSNRNSDIIILYAVYEAE